MEDWQLEFTDAESMFEEVKRLREKLSTYTDELKKSISVIPVSIQSFD